MSCGCAAPESSPLLTGGGRRRRRTTTKKSTTKKSTTKKSTTTTKRRVKKRTTKRKGYSLLPSWMKMRGGGASAASPAPLSELPETLTGSKIPLRVQSSPDWVLPGQPNPPPPYAIDLGSGMQSWLFGRPTPDGKDFMVASGLVEQSKGVIDMVGGRKAPRRRRRTTTTKRKTTKHKTTKRKTTKRKTTTRKRRTTRK